MSPPQSDGDAASERRVKFFQKFREAKQSAILHTSIFQSKRPEEALATSGPGVFV
jgi:hypothetical protein